MPNVTPSELTVMRRRFLESVRETMPDFEPFSPPGVCESCGENIDEGTEDYRIGIDGCWIHESCLGLEAELSAACQQHTVCALCHKRLWRDGRRDAGEFIGERGDRIWAHVDCGRERGLEPA